MSLTGDRAWRDSIALYNAFAAGYDAAFAAPGHRKAYDRLAWEHVSALLPPAPGLIVDAGCGTGRWIAPLLALGHRVIGIEQAPDMVRALRAKRHGAGFALIDAGMESAQIAAASADLVMAIGSVQYTPDPAAMIQRFSEWAKPGGAVCVMVDSLVALVLELIRLGKPAEAVERLRTGRGVFAFGGQQADLFLYDSRSLQAQFAAAGLIDVDCRGLLVSSSAWGSEGCSRAMTADETAFLDLERALSCFPAMADAGKHLFVSGRRPA
jgi:SAM-dependent methyltransferase